MPKQGYTQLPSGFWTKDSDASSPYLFDGEKMIFYTGGGESSVDVLATVIQEYKNNTQLPENGDTLQDALDKFYTMLVENQNQINQLNGRISQLEADNSDLKSRVEALEATE